MDMPDETTTTRGDVLAKINSPLAFFGMALLIIEAFLAVVLVGAGLTDSEKVLGMWMGVTLFVAVLLLVFLLVWFKARDFVYDRDAHLDELRLEAERQVRANGASLDTVAAAIERSLREDLASKEFASQLAQEPREKVSALLEEKADKINKDIGATAFITVDLSSFGPAYGVKKYPIAAFKTFSKLTNEVYFALGDAVRPYTYGSQWVLRDKSNPKLEFRSLRMLLKQPRIPGKPIKDPRTLEELGIGPGAVLEAVRV